MHFIGVFNRDGGTFRTTDMDAFAARAVEIFAAAGHDLDARIVEGKHLDRASSTPAAGRGGRRPPRRRR